MEAIPEAEGQLEEEPTNADAVAKSFARDIEAVLRGNLRVSQIGTVMLDCMNQLASPLGKFRQLFADHAVAPGKPAACTELLPISVEAIQKSQSWNPSVRDWMAFICLVLNYQYCSGFGSKKYMHHPEELTKKQRLMLDVHLRPAVERMLDEDTAIPVPEEIKRDLDKKGHDYEGGSYVIMEELEVDKVVECWPAADQAAVAPLEEFLEGDTRLQVLTPMASILPKEEWPEQVPKSYVRATDEVWASLVKVGYQRGLFQACPDDEVLKGPNGEAVLNGAGAVPKMKGDKQLQRFISIFCPLNSVSNKISGDESTLPYVGQVNLLQVPDECEVVIDSEDMASAFNLFRMPDGWRGLFVYEKKVPAHCLGLEGTAPTYVALRTVPMGWLSAVGLVQSAIRHLAFKIAKLPASAEIQKHKEIPSGDKLLLYLDSVDQLRLVTKTMAKVLEGEPSEEHRRFKEACVQKGLPTNAAKELAGSLKGSLQGGELLSEDGVFMLQRPKMRMNLGFIAYLLSCQEWEPNAVAGVVGRLVFAAAFRRPILSFMDEVFMFLQKKGRSKPHGRAVEELVCMMAAMPLAFTNVRAKIHPVLSATDASPTGGGSCTAHQLKRPLGVPSPQQLTCGQCRTDVSELVANGDDTECPFGCGNRFCSMECFLDHKEQCSASGKELPLFSERWSGGESPLTRAVLQEGFDVTRPFDIKVSSLMDIFSDSGKAIWDDLDATPIDAEHHAPDCKTMSRARGRPFWLNGRWIKGPPALRDEKHVMGFPNLSGPYAVQVRQGNRMALRSVKRCKELHEAGRVFTLEHPWRSFFWYMKATVELASLPGVRMAVFSNCCYGGAREKWTALLTNSSCVYEELHKPDCEHGLTEDYQPYEDETGRVIYPTEKEAQYPWGLCQAYAVGLRREMEQRNQWPDAEAFRLQQISGELLKYSRFADEELRKKVAQRILRIEARLVTGNEAEARHFLLNNGHYRGTDIRFAVEHLDQRELIPYPAYRWLWRDTLSFRWKQEAHINELETQAMIAHVRRMLREPDVQQVRLMVVVDSQVLFFAVGKGRSPSKRINRLLKRLAALQLLGDLYVMPIWTLSYQRALMQFFEWLDEEDEPIPKRHSHLDRLLSQYFEHLWLDDVNITYAGHVLSAIRRFCPQLKFRLPIARQFFSNWKSVHVTKQAVPLPATVALALAGVAVAAGDHTLALQILLGFIAFLRTGEIAALTVSRIQADPTSGQIILALPATKTSKQKLESVAVVDVRLARLAAFVLEGDNSLGMFSATQFRSKLRLLLKFLKLQEHGFSGYSLRRGGASFAFANGTHFDALLVMGRWQSVKTARQYLDSGRAALVQLRLSPHRETNEARSALCVSVPGGSLDPSRAVRA
eukprot:s51_g6.t1